MAKILKMEKSRLLKQKSALAFKYNLFKPNTEIRFEELERIERKVGNNGEERPFDIVHAVTSDGDSVKIPVSELDRMRTKDKSPVLDIESGIEEVTFPAGVVIQSSTDRVGRDQQVMYPVGAYKEAQKLFDGQISYEEMVKAGLKDNHGLSPLQNYVVEVI